MKTGHKPRVHKFETNTRWIRLRKGLLSGYDKDPIEIACPPEFGGHHGYWTAEHLFVASVEICIMTTFKWLLEKNDGKLVAYESTAIGKAQMVNGDFRFNEIEIKPVITVPDAYLSKAKRAIENAHRQCLISKALNLKVKVNSVIRCQDG